MLLAAMRTRPKATISTAIVRVAGAGDKGKKSRGEGRRMKDEFEFGILKLCLAISAQPQSTTARAVETPDNLCQRPSISRPVVVVACAVH